MVLFLASASGSADLHLGQPGIEVGLDVAIGIVLPWIAILAESSRFFSALTIVISMVAHSSADVVVVRFFGEPARPPPGTGRR